MRFQAAGKADYTFGWGQYFVGNLAAYGLLCGLGWLSACSTLIGDEPLSVNRIAGPTGAAQLLPISGRLRSAHVLVGELDAVHLALVSPEPDPMDELVIGKTQVLSLTPPYAVTELPERAVAFPPSPARGFCSATLGSDLLLPALSLHRPGLPTDGPYPALVQPAERLRLLCGEQTLVAYGQSRDNLGIDLLRRRSDGKVVHKLLPWPAEADPAWGQGPLGFDASERVLFLLGGDITTRAYFMDSGDTVNLGVLYWGAATKSGQLFVDSDGMLLLFDIDAKRLRFLGARLSPDGAVIGTDREAQAVLTCDWDGLRRVPLFAAAGPAKTIDRDPCRPSDWNASAQASVLYYVDDQLRQAATSGDSAPLVLTNYLGQQLLALCDDGALAYSLDPPERYGRGIGSGYLGGHRFMERGRDVRFSPDCRRVYYKESAATLRRLGELRSWNRSEPDPSLATLRLADNVGFYHVLADGRILAQDNLATVGDHNRLSLIDPDRLTAQTLLTGPIAVLALNQLSRTVKSFPESRVLLEVDSAEITGPRRMMLVEIPPK